MTIEADFSVTVAGDIRHDSGTDTFTVLEFHRYLQALADDNQASGNDLIDITSTTPSDRATDAILTLLPPYNIDDDAAEYLFGGSITQYDGDTVYSGLQVLGSVATAATQLKIIQDNQEYYYTTTPSAPYWGTQSGGGYNGSGSVLMRVLLKSREFGCDIDNKAIRVQARHWGDTYAAFGATLGEGEATAAITTVGDPQNDTSQVTVAAYTHLTNSGGTVPAPTGGYQTIDLGDGSGPLEYFSQWTFGADTSGDGLKGLYEWGKDLSGTGTARTIDTLNGELYLGISHEVFYDTEVGGPFNERETVVWGTDITYDTLVSGPFTPGNYVTIGVLGAAGRVMDDDGSATLIVALEDTTITLVDGDAITEYAGPGAGITTTTAAINVTILNNGLSGGSGLLLALDDNGADGEMYMQVLTGVAPVDTLPLLGVTSNATAEVATTVTPRTIEPIFLGSYTGSLIGAYGQGYDPDDVTNVDTLKDLANVSTNPPNNVTFEVTGLEFTGDPDRVLIGNRTGLLLDRSFDTINGTLTDNVTATVVTTTAIPTDTPGAISGGTIRVEDDNGVFTRQPYDSYTGSTFTLTAAYQGSDDANATTGNDYFISYLDKAAAAATESFTTIYLSDRDIFVRVRNGGSAPIKTFEGTGAVITSTGGSIAAIRQTDE